MNYVSIFSCQGSPCSVIKKSLKIPNRTREDKYQKLNRNKERNVTVRAMSLYCYCKDTLVRTKQLRF